MPPIAPIPPILRPGVPLDQTAPRFVGRIRTSLAAVRKRPSRKRPSFRFRLSEPATVSATVTRTAPGVRKGKRCVAAGRKAPRSGRRCTRTVTVTSVRTNVPTNAGTATLRLKPSGLPRGRYRVLLVATDASGNRSATTVGLRIR